MRNDNGTPMINFEGGLLFRLLSFYANLRRAHAHVYSAHAQWKVREAHCLSRVANKKTNPLYNKTTNPLCTEGLVGNSGEALCRPGVN